MLVSDGARAGVGLSVYLRCCYFVVVVVVVIIVVVVVVVAVATNAPTTARRVLCGEIAPGTLCTVVARYVGLLSFCWIGRAAGAFLTCRNCGISGGNGLVM